MAVNDFLPFAAVAGANVQSQNDYQAASSTQLGFVRGLAYAAQANKVWRQASFVTSAVTQFVSDELNVDVRDDGNRQLLVDKLKSAIQRASLEPGEAIGEVPEHPPALVYGRRYGQWEDLNALYLRLDALNNPAGLDAFLRGDAPSDGELYARKDAAWSNIGPGPLGTVTTIGAGVGLTGGIITHTGTISLANTAVSAGTYTYATVTVDQQGRITDAHSNSVTPGTGTVQSVTAGAGLAATNASGASVTAITTSGTLAVGVVDIAHGGTNAQTIQQARANLGITEGGIELPELPPYSINEHPTNRRWINNRMIYQRTYQPNTLHGSFEHHIAHLQTVVRFEGWGHNPVTGTFLMLPHAHGTSEDNQGDDESNSSIGISVNMTHITISSTGFSKHTAFTDVYVTLFYTATDRGDLP
jgi:hypothetical protein